MPRKKIFMLVGLLDRTEVGDKGHFTQQALTLTFELSNILTL